MMSLDKADMNEIIYAKTRVSIMALIISSCNLCYAVYTDLIY